MDLSLIASAVLLGLAGTPHCAAMCGAPCAAAVGRGGGAPLWGFHLARVGSYALAGALAALSLGSLAALAQWSPALRPLWTLLHAAALMLGLWLMWAGRQPLWMTSTSRWQGTGAKLAVPAGPRREAPARWRAAAAGAAWAAWPCGLLHSALVLAALTQTAWAGATAMAAFAVASSGGLLAAPWLWARVGRSGAAWRWERGLVRGTGALLAGASAWVLGQGLWQPFLAFCREL